MQRPATRSCPDELGLERPVMDVRGVEAGGHLLGVVESIEVAP